MAEIYGHRWTSSYGDRPLDTWRRALDGLLPSELGAGIRACLNSGSSWPPSLGEFKAFCRPPKRENERMYHAPPERQLPHKRSEAEIERGRAAIAQIKAQLR